MYIKKSDIKQDYLIVNEKVVKHSDWFSFTRHYIINQIILKYVVYNTTVSYYSILNHTIFLL